MEKTPEKKLTEINLRNKEVRIILPGHFDMIHAGHSKLIQDVKSYYKIVYLILGIINDKPRNSLLSLHEKIETFRNMSEVNEVCILSLWPSLEDLGKMNIDYVATANPNAPLMPNKVLYFEKKVNLSTDEIIARVVRDYNGHVDNLLQVGYNRSKLKISKFSEVSFRCKRKLKKVKADLWRNGFSLNKLENSVDSARFCLRNAFIGWMDSYDEILKKWLRTFKGTSSSFLNFLKEVWEAA